MREAYPLQWPQGWPRTPIKDRESRPAWKKTENQIIDALELELKRFGVLAWTITRKDPRDIRTAPDPSVSLLFSRKHEDDFEWQSALEITNPAPSLEEIEVSFRKLAQRYHPDNKATGEHEIFLALDKHKKNAIAFVSRLAGAAHEYSIGCDKFKEAKWNINAIRNTIHSFRQMERDGTSRIVDRAMSGFQTALTEGSPDVITATA